MDEREAIAAAARAHLRKRGAETVGVLAGALVAAGVDLGPAPAAALDELLLDEPGFDELPDGRLVDLASAVDGAVATRRLTAAELDAGAVTVEPDLALLLVPDVDEYVVAGGGVARLLLRTVDADVPDLDGDWILVGPAGWLGEFAAGDVVAFRVTTDTLSVHRAQAAASDETAVDVLAQCFDALCDDENDVVESSDLLLLALVEYPPALRQVLRPLSQLYAEIGLEVHGEWVGAPGAAWPDEEGSLLESVLGLDAQGREALALLVGAYDLASDEGLEALRAAGDLAAMLAKIASHPAVAEAFLAVTVGGRPERAPDVTAFAKVLAAADRREPAPHWLLAACGEYMGSTEADEAHLHAALAADPDYQPALLDAAWYAEDRGDAAAALSLLRRAGIDADDPQLARVVAFARPGPAAVGRNDRCPCGSGRKYKVCCAARNGYPLTERAVWLLGKAWSFAQRPAQRRSVQSIAVARTDVDFDDPAWVDAALHDPLVSDLALFEAGLLEAFCDERGPLLPADELALARAWSTAEGSVYEVTAAEPGAALELRDVRTGERVRVVERAGSEELRRGAYVFAHVIPVGDEDRLTPGTITIPFGLRDRLVAFLDTEPPAEAIAAWFADAEAPPQLVNFEGEPTVLCTATYRVADGEDAWAGLGEVLDVDEDRVVERTETDGREVVRGWIRRDPELFVIEANSEARLARLQAMLLEVAPDAELVDEQRVLPSDVLAGAAYADVSAAVTGDEDPPPELVAFLDQHMAEQERRWVDESIPALGGLTPRQAADDPTRRADLQRLLDEFDAQSTRLPPGARSFDVARLRALLDLPAGADAEP
jgi:hypothetical protein